MSSIRTCYDSYTLLHDLKVTYSLTIKCVLLTRVPSIAPVEEQTKQQNVGIAGAGVASTYRPDNGGRYVARNVIHNLNIGNQKDSKNYGYKAYSLKNKN